METATDLTPASWAERKAALCSLQKMAEQGVAAGEHYRLDRMSGFSYLELFPKWQREIADYLRQLKQDGTEPVYVDVCGRATLREVIGSKNYNFSLQSTDAHWHIYDDVRFQGNIFAARDFARFLQHIRQAGDEIAFATFVPVAGLQGYDSDRTARLQPTAAYARLARNLERLIAALRPGGYAYLAKPFQGMDIREFFQRVPQSEYRSSLWLKEFCRTHGCALRIEPTMFGPKWLIRKSLRRSRGKKISVLRS